MMGQLEEAQKEAVETQANFDRQNSAVQTRAERYQHLFEREQESCKALRQAVVDMEAAMQARRHTANIACVWEDPMNTDQ